MQLTNNQIEFIKNSKFGIIATSKDNHPRACIAMPEIAENDYVIFADVQMKKTNVNIQSNAKVFVSFYDEELVHCLKADGVAEYITTGDTCEKIKAKLKPEGLSVKAVIKIKLSNIFEGKEE